MALFTTPTAAGDFYRAPAPLPAERRARYSAAGLPPFPRPR